MDRRHPLAGISALAILLVAPNVCFALIEIELVSNDRAKALGLEIRSNAAGPDAVRVELEFETKGELKSYSRVDLEIQDGGKLLSSSTLREEKSKLGWFVVGFAADRSKLDTITLRVIAHPGTTIDGAKTTFPEKSNNEGAMLALASLESCSSDDWSGAQPPTLADFEKAKKGNHVHFAFGHPIRVELMRNKIEVTELVYCENLGFLVRTEDKVYFGTKYTHDKMTAFEKWCRQTLPADIFTSSQNR